MSKLLWLLIPIGGMLVLSAGPVAHAIPPRFQEAVYSANIIFWILIGLYCARQAWLRCRTPKELATAMLFWAGVLIISAPEDSLDVETITIQSLTFMGVVALAIGCTHSCRFKLLDALLKYALGMSGRLYLSILCVVFLAITIGQSWYCYHFLPTVIDSISQYVHAKFMAQGMLYGQSPPENLRAFFYYGKTINDGKWYSQYQPLQIFLISLGHRIYAPWLVNPLEGMVTLIAVYALARRNCDETTARIAALLFACSPFVLFMSSEYMSHAAALMMTTLFILCYIAMLQTLDGNQRKIGLAYAVAAALCLGGLFLIRPLTCLAVALPFVAHGFYLVVMQPKRHALPFAAGIGILIAVLLFQGWYNQQLTGDPWLFPYVKAGADNMPGFNRGYTFENGVRKAWIEWNKMNVMLFEWGIQCSLLVMFSCLYTPLNRNSRLMVAMMVSLTLVNISNRYSGMIWGPRYIYETVTALIILTAIALVQFPVWARRHSDSLPDLPVLYSIELVILGVVMLGGLGYKMPQYWERYSHHYIHGNKEFYAAMLQQAEQPALVFIEEKTADTMFRNYTSLAHTNPPEDHSPVIFARDLGAQKDRELIAYYPNRHVYSERNGTLYPWND